MAIPDLLKFILTPHSSMFLTTVINILLIEDIIFSCNSKSKDFNVDEVIDSQGEERLSLLRITTTSCKSTVWVALSNTPGL